MIITEKSNPNTINIDCASSLEIAQMINNEDLKVAQKINEIVLLRTFSNVVIYLLYSIYFYKERRSV